MHHDWPETSNSNKEIFRISGKIMDVRIVPARGWEETHYEVQYEYSKKLGSWRYYLDRNGYATAYDTLNKAKAAARRVHKRNNPNG